MVTKLYNRSKVAKINENIKFIPSERASATAYTPRGDGFREERHGTD